MRSDRHRTARAEAQAVAELLRQALQRLGFTPDVPHGVEGGELYWPTLRGELTVSGYPLVALGRIPLDSANRLADVLMRAAMEERTKKAAST
ncbi:hypothetical protein PS467_14350 [Streptomyces luomodiensis]|uniref:Uncharacterized protein n=1 Tax=Streptomyces luomodiensis TaxID=3026192 RepID=A0ABY9UVT9_9ACTN|nr:hypothetical protein [Streptomyces sp. SCA4-21]WNE96431.1 hypothetical protein PS467_14350 [Streptomyces sp. SCA4-21]